MKQHLSHTPGPIGVFDSGYGGLTILNKIREALPEYDYVYLGPPSTLFNVLISASKLFEWDGFFFSPSMCESPPRVGFPF